MHSAPPVAVPVGRFVWGWRISAALAVVSGLALCLWRWLYPVGAMPSLALACGWLALLLLSALAWRREAWPAGQLRWDGQAWCFEQTGDGQVPFAVDVRLVWDGAAALCLRLSATGPTGPRGFVWLRACDMPLQWHALRCALCAADSL
jgi:hypothetical protein